MAYQAKRDRKWHIIVNGVEGKGYEYVYAPVFSPDSKRVAYAARVGDKWRLVLDGVEGKDYDGIYKCSHCPRSVLVFSATSDYVIYLARRHDKWRLVADNWEGSGLKRLPVVTLCLDCRAKQAARRGSGLAVFSPDSKRRGYAHRRRGKWRVVVDGLGGPKYDAVGKPVFSPDSRRVAYVARGGGKWQVVVNGFRGKHYDGFLDYRGRRLVFDGSDSVCALARRGDELVGVEIRILKWPVAEGIYALVALAGWGCLIWGGCHLAVRKGRSPRCGWIGLLPVIGLVIIAFLPGRTSGRDLEPTTLGDGAT